MNPSGGIPDISVIIPAYNAQSYIRRCVESVLRSTFSNYEIIVIDDGSKDDTVKVCKEIQDDRVNIQTVPWGGVSRARNQGIKFARGKYIAFLDSDDWISENMLEKLFSVAESESADMTICNYYTVDENGKETNAGDTGVPMLVFEKENKNHYLYMYVQKGVEEYQPYFPVGWPWATLYRRDVIMSHDVRFPDGLQYKEDAIFNLYMGFYSKKIVRINEPLYFYFKNNSQSLTTHAFKSNMLPRVRTELEKRIEFYNTCLKDDAIFRAGLNQHIVKEFCRIVTVECAKNGDYAALKAFYQWDEVKKAFAEVQYKNLSTGVKLSVMVVKHHGLRLYYLLIRLLVSNRIGLGIAHLVKGRYDID